MYWSTEDHRHHQPNYYNNFQIVQHQNGIQQATAALPPQQQQQQQQQHSAPPSQLQQQQQSTHRPAQPIPSHYSTNQQLQHQQHQWATRPPILTAPPFFQQFPTTVPSSTQYCAAPAQYFHPQRVAAPSQQRPLLPPGCAMYPIPPQAAPLRQNVISQPSATIMTPTTSTAQQVQVQYFSTAQYCQPPMGQPTYGHVITPSAPETPVVKHRKHAIPIIDPRTRENILERELRKSEPTSPADALSIAATSSSTSTDLKESENDLEDEQQQQQQPPQQQQQQQQPQQQQQHQQPPSQQQQQQQQQQQHQQQHHQHHHHHPPHQQIVQQREASTATSAVVTTAEREQTDGEVKENEKNEQLQQDIIETSTGPQTPTQVDHVDEPTEAEEEVEVIPTDEENQSKNSHNDDFTQNQTTNHAPTTSNSSSTPISSCSIRTPSSASSAITTPVTNKNDVELSKYSSDEDTDKETAPTNVAERNLPIVVEVVGKPSASNQKSSTAAPSATQAPQQNITKMNKQQQTQKQQPQQQPPPQTTKSSSKKNKKNKRMKENQKKQQKTELLNLENNNNTIKTTNQFEIKSKQILSSSEPYSSSSSRGTTSKAKENANNNSSNISGRSTDRTGAVQTECTDQKFSAPPLEDDFKRNNESTIKVDAVTGTSSNVKEKVDQITQSEISSPKLMKSKEISSEILGIESTDDNELLFLNSSVSGYEEDICSSPPVQETSASNRAKDLLFGDFSQENPAQEISMQDDNESLDEVDDMDNSLGSNPKEGRKLSYTLQQLKNLANKPDSKIPPTFRGKICDMIGKNLRGTTAAPHMQPAYQQNQMFQQLSYKDSMSYLNRKRNKRMNDMPPYQQYQQQYEQQQQQHQRNPDIIRINLSLNEEIQLAKSENAWVPAGLQMCSLKADSENDEQILKKIRGILNKLTPENFDKLLQSAANFPMTGEERMKKVMLLIFEKTVSEPNFAPTYARFCKFLFNPQNQNHSTFKANLIKRIREEFDSNVNNAKAKNAKLKPLMEKLAAATDPKEQLELKAELDDQEYQFRRRAWGTVRFIGEMCKVGFIGTDRVCMCVENLLDPQCEEKLEYMCKLLSTVGAQLEPLDNKQQASGEKTKIVERLDAIFSTIRRLLVEKKKGTGQKISSRVRFMMQDVLELRTRCWDQKAIPILPSREVSPGFSARGPPSQRGVRMGGGGSYMSSGGYEKRRQTGDGQKNTSQLNIDVNKLLPLFSKDETTRKLGNSSLLMWKTTGRSQQQQQHQLAPPTMQQNNRHQSGSLESESKESGSSQQMELTNNECERLLNGLIEVTVEEEAKKYWFDKWKEISPAFHSKIIYHLLADYIHSRKYIHSPPEINACNRLFTSLMKENLLTRASFSEGYRKFSLICEEILVDVPKCWQYVFNLLGPLLYNKLIPFDLIWNKNWYNSSVGDKFVQSMIIQFTSEFGATYMRSFWVSNSLRWNKFMSDDKVQNFTESNRFEFIENNKIVPPIFVQRSADELVQRIKALLGQSDQNMDLIYDYINTNVNIDSNFIKNLTMFLCDFTVIYCNTPNSSSISSNSSKNFKLSDSLPSALSTSSSSSSAAAAAASTSAITTSCKLREDLFVSKCIPLLRRCMDCKDDRELACLDAIVERCKQLCESPAEDLISAMVMELYGADVISKESFEKWQQEQKLRAKGNNKLTNELDAFFKKLPI